MSDEQLALWGRLAAAASSGPWVSEADAGDSPFHATVGSPDRYVADCTWDGVGPQTDADARFIAASREAVPALTKEVRRLQADLDRLRTPVPGDTVQQAAAWSATWKALEEAGILGHLPVDSFTHPEGMTAKHRAVSFIRELADHSKRAAAVPFQERVRSWVVTCFGPNVAGDKAERCHRFLEEALELVQAGGCPADDAHKLVDYVYGRPSGELPQEVGGVMTTLAALCEAFDLDMQDSAETELARVWTKVEQIREKQRRKPPSSPLPGSYPCPIP